MFQLNDVQNCRRQLRTVQREKYAGVEVKLHVFLICAIVKWYETASIEKRV
jgi:hypothetical protein